MATKKDDLSSVDLDSALKNANNPDATGDQTGDAKGWPDTLTTDETKLQSYKAIQGMATQKSQENKALKEELATIKREKELGDQTSFVPGDQTTGHIGGDGETFDPYNEESFDARAARVATEGRIQEVLAEEDLANPGEFQERYGYVKLLGARYPNLTRSAAGIKKLFQEADKLRVENVKKSADKAMAHLFGRELTEEDKTKLRGIIGEEDTPTQTDTTTKSNAGYMPDSTSSVRTGQDISTKPNLATEIEEAKKAGDHLRVTELLMQQALEKE